MNLEKYSLEDLRRIRDNINGLLEVVDEINNQTGSQESEESVRGFEGLELTELGHSILLGGEESQKYCFAIKHYHHTPEQLEYIKGFFPFLRLVRSENTLRSVILTSKEVHFNDLFQYKTEDVKS